MNILDIPVSYYRNTGDTLGVPVSLRVLLTSLRPEHREIIEKVRTARSPEEKNRHKKKLPLYTPSSQLMNRNANIPMEQKLTHFSGFMQFDIDQKDNPGMDARQVRDMMIYIPYVAYVGLSVSGEGVWGLVRVTSPENLDQHFSHFRSTVESRTKIKLDSTKGSNPTGLRYISYDPDAKFNLNAFPLPLVRKPSVRSSTLVRQDLGYYGQDNDVVLLVNATVERRLNLLDDYATWFAVGSGFARELGESGRTLFHTISQLSEKYDYTRTERDYSRWMNYSNNKGQLGVFFNVCKEKNLLIRDLKPYIYDYTLGGSSKLVHPPNSPAKPNPPQQTNKIPEMTYHPSIIGNLLVHPNRYTAHEAVSHIISIVPKSFWRQALTDYLNSLQHPDPEIAANAYLDVIDRFQGSP